MSKKQTISVPLIADPRGVNIPIQEMQEALSALPWLQFSYGQARPIITEVEGTRYTMPQVYAGFREFLAMEPDDSSSAFCFFEVVDQGTKAHEFASEWIQRVSLVVYVNLEIIDQLEGLTRDYIYTEELKEEVTNIIREGNLSFIDGETFTIERGIENAFSNYSYWTFDERYIKRNYDAFKLSFEIRFNDQCIDSTIVYDTDYQTLITYWTAQAFTLPTTAHQILQNQHVIELKAAGLWFSMDFYHVYANDNTDIAKTNWLNPGTFDAIEVNAPTFIANLGFDGDGVTSYLDTQFNPVVSGVNYTLADASIGCWVQTIGGTDAWIMGNTNTRIRQKSSGSRINSNNVLGSTGFETTVAIIKAVGRGDTANAWTSKSGTVTPAVNASVAESSDTIHVLAVNGAVGTIYGGIISNAFAGADIDGSQGAFNTSFNTYISSL